VIDYPAAIDSADFLLRHVYRIDVSKALDPLDPKDFITISGRLQDAVRGAVRGHEARALKQALKRLDVNWPNLTSRQIDAVIASATNALKVVPGQTIQPVQTLFVAHGKAMVRATKASISKTFKLDVSATFNAADKRAIADSVKNQAHFFRDEYGKRNVMFAQTARDIVADGLSKGEDRNTIGARLDRVLTVQGINRSRAYWNMVSSVHMNRSRTYSSLVSYKEARIEQYIFEAVMDEVTSAQCRYMHGRVFTVERALQKHQEVVQATNPEDVKYITPWLNVGRSDDGTQVLYVKERDGSRTTVADIRRSGVGTMDDRGSYVSRLSEAELVSRGVIVPPTHGQCRSRLVPDI
jgi:SPP1 gp7 family putative phage head morphogenesis protein